MISTIIAITLDDVPSTWIFEHYLKIEPLHGQTVVIKSVFNDEKTPSMHIYYDRLSQKYKFKDFSSGKYGFGVNLVCELCTCDFSTAATKITNDYNRFVEDKRGKIDIYRDDKFRVTDHVIREWNTDDAKFWMSFCITSKILSIYNVMPINNYIMEKNTEHIVIEKPFMYGYFNSRGELCKIYRPYNKEGKFIKVKPLTPGYEQLKFNKPYLGILSSLKDIMSFRSLGIGNIELIAPDDGESSSIPHLDKLKSSYKSICTLMDNDTAGNLAKAKYEAQHEIPGCILNRSKDVSDSIRDFGVETIRPEVISLLRKTLKISL